MAGVVEFERPEESAKNERASSMRPPSYFLSLEPKPSDNYLGDHLLGKQLSLGIIGQGGIGKSRLGEQLACALITGTPFLGFESRAENCRVVVFQTENSELRLRADMEAMRRHFSGQWDAVEERLRIVSLNGEEYAEGLAGEAMRAEITRTMREFCPTVAVVDPLKDFSLGNLDRDEDMATSLRLLSALLRAGDPSRAIILLHHALTGKGGAAKATGFDRSGFGRNSKVLLAWLRAQINVAPASSEDNSRLVVACGKCSNGKEFAPFGIQLNSSLTYEVDPSFNLEDWRTDIGIATAKAEPTCKPEVVRELLNGSGMLKVELVKAVQEETGCKKSRAYDVIDAAQMRRLIRYDKATRRLHAS